MNRYRFTAAIGAAAMALALIGAGAAPAMAAPSTSVPVSANLSSSIGFQTLPTAVNFGNALVGGTTVVSSPVSITGNSATYTLTVTDPSGSGLINGGTPPIPDTDVFWFPSQLNGMTGQGQSFWADFGDSQQWGTDSTSGANNLGGPSLTPSAPGSGPSVVMNKGNMGPTGIGTIMAEWALRLPVTQPAGSYTGTWNYALTS